MIRLILFATLSLPIYAQSTPASRSAVRLPHETAQQAYLRLHASRPRAQSTGQSAYDLQVPFTQISDVEVSHLPTWPNSWGIQTLFAKYRDVRFLKDPDQANFLRRISWLYPDDGCFARAALFSRHMGEELSFRPGKVFIFGSLNVDTQNSPSGSVNWWYHVVPAVVQKGPVNEVMVFDAAIEPARPLPLRDWVMTMTKDVSNVSLSFCDANTYEPDSPCLTPTETDDQAARQDQMYYLSAERRRVNELGRDPNKELGDAPQWLPFLY